MSVEVAELLRRLNRLMMPGIVHSVPRPGWVRVKQGDYVTGALKVFQSAAGNHKTHRPIKKGEQVLCLFPGGGEVGFALRGLTTETNALPTGAADGVTIDAYEDGTIITYDENSHELSADVKGTVKVKATGGVDIDGIGGLPGLTSPCLHAGSLCPLYGVAHINPSNTVKVSL